jgi:hypothetical protein
VAKYDPLSQHLMQQAGQEILMTFAEVEAVIGATLPPSAKAYPEWWANESNPRTTHVQARSWLDAGFRTTVNLSCGMVTFRKATSSR